MRKHVSRLVLWIALLLVGLVAGSARQAAASPRAGYREAIRAVLSSPLGPAFRYFPHHIGTARCSIPFVFRSVRGTCGTRVVPRRGFSGQIFVNFSERWPWHEFHYAGTPQGRLHHHWVFDLLPSGKVILARQTGDFPPNYAR